MMSPVRRLVSIGSLGAPLWAAVVLVVLRAQGDPDYWWHLRVGEWIATHHDVPHVELLSWLSTGPWTAHEWAGELLLYWLHSVSGVYGAILLLGAVNIAALVVMASIVRLLRPGVGGLTLAALAVGAAFVAEPIWLPRLQAFDLLFGLLALRAALAYLERGRQRGLRLMPIFMIAWVNLHGGGVSVYLLIMAAVLAGEWWNRRQAGAPAGQPWRPLLVSLGLTVAAMALNPVGPAIYLYPLTTVASPAMQDLIVEWQSPDFHLLSFRFAQAFIAFGLVGLTALARVRDGRALALAGGLAFMFLQSGRYIGFLATAGMAVMGPYLIDGAQILWLGLRGRPFSFAEPARWRAPRAIALGLVVVALLAGQLAGLPSAQDAAMADQPVAAANWLADHPAAGRLFNDYDWGGYLSWRLRTPVGFYGAADAFGEEGLRTAGALAALTTDPAAFLDTHAVAAVVTRGQGPLGQWLSAAPGWQRVYADDLTVVYERAGRAVARP